MIYGSTIVIAISLSLLYTTDTRALIYKYIAPLVLRLLFPDTKDVYYASTRALKKLYIFGVYPRERGVGDIDSKLSIEAFSYILANLVSILGELDKNIEILDPLFTLG